MFLIFSQRREATNRLTRPSKQIGRVETSPNIALTSANPQSQAELISETLNKLQQVKQMLSTLPQLPTGDRDQVIQNLTTTSDQLKTLAFLDVIY